jgi:hypothetical protein
MAEKGSQWGNFCVFLVHNELYYMDIKETQFQASLKLVLGVQWLNMQVKDAVIAKWQ